MHYTMTVQSKSLIREETADAVFSVLGASYDSATVTAFSINVDGSVPDARVLDWMAHGVAAVVDDCEVTYSRLY